MLIARRLLKFKYGTNYGYVKTNQITKVRPILFQDMQLDAAKTKAIFNQVSSNLTTEGGFITLGYKDKLDAIAERNMRGNTFMSNTMNDFKKFRIKFTNAEGKKYDEPIVFGGSWARADVNFVNIGKKPTTMSAYNTLENYTDYTMANYLFLKVYKHKPSGNYYIYHASMIVNNPAMSWQINALREQGLVD